MKELLISGKSSFKMEVPYKLYEIGKKEKKKPLIVYLHGYRQNINRFEKLVEGLLDIEAYHLFIQGPYPVYDETRAKKVEDWSRAWYLYDGEQNQFVQSLELASEFIQEIIDSMPPNIEVSRLCVFGYSMGGYLGGYFALSRWEHVNESIIIGARIKTEAFKDSLNEAVHIRFLGLHGANDTNVLPEPQQKEIEKLKAAGFKADFKLLDEEHKLSRPFVDYSRKWLKSIGY